MSRDASIEMTLPARPESVTVVRQALSGLADVNGWGSTFLTDAKIAVSEASTNVVVHAYPDGVLGTLSVMMTLDGDRLVVVVRDQGVGISPRLNDRSAGLGLGMPLMAALSSEVHVKSTDGGHTEVTMVLIVPNGAGE